MGSGNYTDLEIFLKEIKKSKTLRIAIKKCLMASSSTSIFLFSLIESLFSQEEDNLFRRVKWSNVAKTEEFQSWVENFINESTKFRDTQIEEFGKLKNIISKNFTEGDEPIEGNITKLGEKLMRRTTIPNEIVVSLRAMADSISELEGLRDDSFSKKKMERKITNLHNRIEELQSKNFN